MPIEILENKIKTASNFNGAKLQFNLKSTKMKRNNITFRKKINKFLVSTFLANSQFGPYFFGAPILVPAFFKLFFFSYLIKIDILKKIFKSICGC